MTAAPPPTPPVAANPDRRQSPARARPWQRILSVAVLTLAGIYFVKLAGLAWTARESMQRADSQATANAVLRPQVEAMETASVRAGDADAVERFARDHQWARPGERVIAVAPEPTPTPTPTAPVAMPTPPAVWTRLSRWIGGR